MSPDTDSMANRDLKSCAGRGAGIVTSHCYTDLVLQELCAFEAVRLILSQPFNRYSWIVEPPQRVEDFNSDRARRLGQFYSGVVHLLMTPMPNEAKDTSGYKLKVIADYLLYWPDLP